MANKIFKVIKLNRCLFPIKEGEYTADELSAETAKREEKLKKASREGTLRLINSLDVPDDAWGREDFPPRERRTNANYK